MSSPSASVTATICPCSDIYSHRVVLLFRLHVRTKSVGKTKKTGLLATSRLLNKGANEKAAKLKYFGLSKTESQSAIEQTIRKTKDELGLI